MRRMLLAVLTLALMSVPALSQTTTLTGTIRNAQGNPFNGFLRMRLSHAATSSGGFAVIPTWHTFRIRNGALPSNAIVVGNDTLSPINTYYVSEFSTTYGVVVARSNYRVTLASFDVGAAPLTTITTQQVGYLNPANLAGNNAFTGDNTFSGNNTFTGRNSFGDADTFTDLDTTPSISAGNYFVISNTGATTITDFDGGVSGQLVFLQCSGTDIGTIISDAPPLFLAGAFTCTTGDTIVLLSETAGSGNWLEISRSAN